MVRSVSKSKGRVDSPSSSSKDCKRRGLAKKSTKKRQEELETHKSLSTIVKKSQRRNEKLDFSKVRSAFAAYTKDTSEPASPASGTGIAPAAGIENEEPRKRSVQRSSKDTSSDNGRPHMAVELMQESTGTCEQKLHSGINVHSPTSASGDISDNSGFLSPEDPAYYSSDAQHKPETVESADPKFQAKCDEYAEAFLNFKNLVKSQNSVVLPKVIVIPLTENRQQTLVGFNEDIHLYGCAKIGAIKGVVKVHGSVLSPNKPDVTFYAPLHDPAFAIKVDSAKNKGETNANKIEDMIKGVTSVAAEDVKKLQEFSTIVHFRVMEQLKLPKYQNLFNAPPQNVPSKEICKGCYLVGSTNCALTEFPGYYLSCQEILSENDTTENVPSSTRMTVVTVGSKGAGKSTFNRYLLNSLLNQYDMVNYIDCDIGQPEFTIPGCVSVNHVTSPLLGPPFTHLDRPAFCTYYGALTASFDVDRYTECVKNVLLHVRPGYPTIVNTMGWVKDIGMNILADILRLMQPNYVVQLSSRREYRAAPLITKEYADQFGSLFFSASPEIPEYKHFWIKTDFTPSNLVIANPADRRKLRTISYLSQIQKHCAMRDLSISTEMLSLQVLCRLKPYVVFLKDILLCVCHESGILRDHALSVFNCSIVSLSVVSKKDFGDHSTKMYLEPPPTSKCYGFGIVRGVDPRSKALHVISSMPREILCKVNCLCVGSVTIPDILYNTGDMKATDVASVPYVVEDFPFHIAGSNKFRSYRTFK